MMFVAVIFVWSVTMTAVGPNHLAAMCNVTVPGNQRELETVQQQFDCTRNAMAAAPVESLVTGSALWAYTLPPALVVLCFSGSWDGIIRLAGARARMISQVHDLPMTVAAVSAIGPVWLVYVLRHSTDSPTEFSVRSQVVVWEIVSVCWFGVAAVLWCWSFQREEALRRARLFEEAVIQNPLARTILWLAAAAWPLVPLAFTDDADMLDHLFSTNPLLLSGLVVAVGGFAFELASFRAFMPRDEQQALVRRAMAAELGVADADHFRRVNVDVHEVPGELVRRRRVGWVLMVCGMVVGGGGLMALNLQLFELRL